MAFYDISIFRSPPSTKYSVYLLLMNSLTLNEKVNRLKVVGYSINETNVRKTSFQFMMTICVFTSF